MNESLGPFNLILLVLPGVGLKIAVRAMYGRKSFAAADPLKLLLSIASTAMLTLAGLGAVLGLVGMPTSLASFLCFWLPLSIVLATLAMLAADRFRQGEHRALVWALAAAAERGLPLTEAASAFADETLGDTGARALALARGLAQGQSLAQAVDATRLRVATALRLAIRLGERLGVLGSAMRQELEDSADIDATLRTVVGRIIYLGTLCLSGAILIFVVAGRVVPQFGRVFRDLGQEMPWSTQVLFEASKPAEQLFDLGEGLLSDAEGVTLVDVEELLNLQPLPITGAHVILGIIEIGALALMALVAAIVLGWITRDLPLVWRLFRRYDGALVLRGLALAVQRGQPLTEGLKLLAAEYPIQRIARRIAAAAARVEQGADWRKSLQEVRLIHAADAAVLAAAERTGNLAWALDEMADSALRRLIYRMQLGMQVLFPMAILAIAAVVSLFAVAIILPIVRLIMISL